MSAQDLRRPELAVTRNKLESSVGKRPAQINTPEDILDIFKIGL